MFNEIEGNEDLTDEEINNLLDYEEGLLNESDQRECYIQSNQENTCSDIQTEMEDISWQINNFEYVQQAYLEIQPEIDAATDANNDVRNTLKAYNSTTM